LPESFLGFPAWRNIHGADDETNNFTAGVAKRHFVGLDPTDAAGKDDAQLTTLVIPLDRPVELTLRSKDVIHSFFVPALRFKQDSVPGMSIKVHFTANTVGKYEIPCAELCGSLHYNMKSNMLVVPSDEFDRLMAMSEEKFKDALGELIERYPY
jgi:cytochrome c oxidase subunit 2